MLGLLYMSPPPETRSRQGSSFNIVDIRIVRSAFARIQLGGSDRGDVMSKNSGPLLRVLAIDDERDVADSTAALLRCFGVDVRAVYDGLTALAVISEFKPHLALIDLCMPGTDGFETARRIRNLPEGGSLVLAAVTAWGHAEARQRAREAGFDYHLIKPLPVEDFEELLALAHRAL